MTTNNEYVIYYRRNEHKVGRRCERPSGRPDKMWTLPEGNDAALRRLQPTLLLLEEVLEVCVAKAQSRVQAVSTCSKGT